MIITKTESTLSVVIAPVAPPPIDYSGKRAWCAYRFYHELPGRNVTTWVVTETAGRIGNLSVELTKAGLAGVEATFKIRTGGETSLEFIALEVLGWWQFGKYITGIRNVFLYMCQKIQKMTGPLLLNIAIILR